MLAFVFILIKGLYLLNALVLVRADLCFHFSLFCWFFFFKLWYWSILFVHLCSILIIYFIFIQFLSYIAFRDSINIKKIITVFLWLTLIAPNCVYLLLKLYFVIFATTMLIVCLFLPIFLLPLLLLLQCFIYQALLSSALNFISPISIFDLTNCRITIFFILAQPILF